MKLPSRSEDRQLRTSSDFDALTELLVLVADELDRLLVGRHALVDAHRDGPCERLGVLDRDVDLELAEDRPAEPLDERGLAAVRRAAHVQPPVELALLGAAEIRYSDSKTLDMTQQVTLLCPFNDGPVSLDWSTAATLDLPVEDLESEAQPGAQFVDAPSDATKAKSYATWRKDLASWLYRNQRLELLESPTLEIVSNPGESERDFRLRLQQLGREQRDDAVEKLRRKYAPKMEQLEERKRRAEQAVAREAEQAKGQKVQTAISFGATLLSSFLGRKRASLSTIGRATTAVRGVGRSMKESQDVDRAEDNVAVISQKLTDLEAEFQSETAALERSFDPQTEQLEKVSLKPTKANIAVKLVTLAWAPYWDDKPAWE